MIGGPEITPSDHPPLAAPTFDATDKTISKLWRCLLDDEAVQHVLVGATRRLAHGKTPRELYTALAARTIPVTLQDLAINVAKGCKPSAWGLVAHARGLADSHLGNDFAGTDEILATAHLFDVLEGDDTIAIRLDKEFREQRRDQREEILELVATLAQGFDVRLICSGFTRRWLADVHRDDLPGVSEWCSTPHAGGPLDSVDDALEQLDPDGRAVRFLKYLADEPGEMLTYGALYAQATVGEARVRQLVGELSGLGLVETYGSQNDRRVELLATGRGALEALRRETTRQQSLSETVSETPKSYTQAVVSERGREGGEDGEAADSHTPYRTRFLDRARRAAASASAAEGGISLLEDAATARESAVERRTKLVEYDAGRDEAVVSIQASGGFQYVTSLATALASPQLLGKIPAARLEELDDPAWLLRGARCIGALSDDALDDPEELRAGLVEWGELIEDLTARMQRGDYEDRDQFRAEIMRTAHGLAGSVVHLLDAMGIDVVRDVRVPRGRDASHLEGLARSIAVSAAIQSRYGAFASYRQLYETDAGQPNLSPNVDAADPAASVIGGFLVRGGDAKRLRAPLLEYIDAPGELQEDSLEFVIRVPLQEPGRREFGAAVGTILAWKNLEGSRDLVSLLHALAPSPFAACRALLRGLQQESFPDVLRADEVRVALSTLEPKEILPELPATVGKVVAALLSSTERISQRELADQADVSTQSIRNHRDRLEALDLIDVDASGWRLTVSFPTRSERRTSVVPPSTSRTFVEVVDDVLEAALPVDRYADPGDPVAQAVFWPPDPWGVVDVRRSITQWVALAGRLAGAERPESDEPVAEMGPRIDQAPLVEASSEVAAP